MHLRKSPGKASSPRAPQTSPRSGSRSPRRSSSSSPRTRSASSPRSKSKDPSIKTETPTRTRMMRPAPVSSANSKDTLIDSLENGSINKKSMIGKNYDDVDLSKKLPSPSSGLTSSDKLSMGLLFILYTLQGIPMGLSASLPLILNERGSGYDSLALFSLVSVPFSLKLLWAPLVDSLYIKSIGRRKTWLIPVQLLTALFLIVGSPYVGEWLGGDVTEANPTPPNVPYLTYFFLVLYFLMATQDIAVDGWALTMLSKENVGYASTCNSIGQVFGIFLSNQGFIALSDPHVCEVFLGMPKGSTLVTLESLMNFAGWVFVVVTALIWLFKTEEPLPPDEEPEGLLETYGHVMSMSKLPSVQTICIVLLTVKVAFAPADSVTGPMLQEYGMPKADIAMYSPIILVMGLALPALVAKWVAKDPIKMVQWGIFLKLITSSLGWIVVRTTSAAYANHSRPSYAYLGALVGVMVGHEIAGTLIYVSFMSFYNRVSDPSIGGTYMTFLNTISNLGSKWPNSLALWLKPRAELFGMDGYTVEMIGALAFGVLWIIYFQQHMKRLEGYQPKDWLVTSAGKNK